MSWQQNILSDPEQIKALLSETRTVAVLGIKTEAQADQPAFYVPRYLQSVGFEVIPVPVYYPEVTQILERSVYRTLAEVPGQVDLVNVFRRSAAVAAHLEDILSKHPKAVWMQSGIQHDQVAEALAKAGVKVVQNRCLMVDHQRLMRANHP